MKRTTKYVALDVHQATTSATVREEGGRVIARSILPTTAPTLVEFFRGMRGAELLRLGALRAVYHSSPPRETLRELARAYLSATLWIGEGRCVSRDDKRR